MNRSGPRAQLPPQPVPQGCLTRRATVGALGALAAFPIQAQFAGASGLGTPPPHRPETPEDYGAIGDGVTPDSAAFARMAAAINARGSGTIYLRGRYLVGTATDGGHACLFNGLSSIRIYGEGHVLAAPLAAAWRKGTRASAADSTVTVFDAGHTLQIGDEIIIQGLGQRSACGYVIVNKVTPGLSFSYAVAVAPGAITGVPEYSKADFNRNIFTFLNCHNVDIDVSIQGEVRDVGLMHRFGYRGIYCSGTCTNVAARLRNSHGLSYGFVQGGTLTQAKIDIEGRDIGYGVSTFGASYCDIRVNIDTVHRGVYFANGGNAAIFCRAANYNSTAVLVTRSENGYTENVTVDAPAAPQTAALTGNRTGGGETVAVAVQNAITGGYRNIRVRAGLNVSPNEGLGRRPVEFNMSGVTGRADDIHIEATLDRAALTDASQIINEIIFKGPPTCVFGDCTIVSVCNDPKTFDLAAAGAGRFVMGVQASDGVISVDRRGGRSGFLLTNHPGANIRWINPPRPIVSPGLSFPRKTNKQVLWTASDILTSDFSVWMRVSDLFEKSGARTMFFAGSSSLTRAAHGVWLNLDDTNNTVSFTIYGATLADFSYRRFTNISRYCVLPGFNDIFAIRRNGALELWVNGTRLVGKRDSGGAAPGEGGRLKTPYIVFNQATNNAFAQRLGGSGFYSKALTVEEMRSIGKGGTIHDKSKILHQSDYRSVRRNRYPNPYSKHTATIGADVLLLDPSDSP